MAMIANKAVAFKRLVADVFDTPKHTGDRMCRECRALVKPGEADLIDHLERLHPRVIPSYINYGKAHVNAKFVLSFFLQKNSSEESNCILCDCLFETNNDLMMENHLRYAHSMDDRQIIAGPTEQEYNLYGLTRNRLVGNPPPIKKTVLSKNGLPVQFSTAAKNANVWQLQKTPQTLTGSSTDKSFTLVNKTMAGQYSERASYNGTSPEELRASAAVVQTCFKKIGNGYRCNYCNRLFQNKQDHILIAHMDAAHPQVQLRDPDVDRSHSPLVDSMTADLSIYFTKQHNRWQCIICKLMFGNSKHCASHMTLKHADVLVKSSKNVKQPERSSTFTSTERTAKLKALRYNPYNMSTVTKVAYDASDPDNLTCDFFENVEDTMQCIICDLLIKTTNVQHLLKHLRMHHSIYHIDDKKYTIGEPQVKRFKPAKVDVSVNIEGDLYASYSNPSRFESDGDYVWNFFEDFKGKLSCICCGQQLTRKTFSSLMKHLQLIHPDVFPNANEKEQLAEQDSLKPQPLYQYRKGKPLKSERSMTSFMINQGVPHEGIYDPNFSHIQHCMSKMASINTPAAFDTVVDELDSDFKRCFVVNLNSAVTASVDFYTEDEDVYMVFALHHFEDDNQRRNNVFLKKMFQTSITLEGVLLSIEDSMRNYGYGTTRLCNVVINQKHKEIFEDCNVKTYYCFYTCLSDFADDIIKLPRFASALNKLFNFLHRLRNDPILVTRFDLIQKGKGTKIDLFQARANLPWYRLKDYLNMIVGDRKNFNLISIFARRWKLEGWIDAEYTEIICHLWKILQKISDFADFASSPDGVVSFVIPSIIDLMTYFKEHFKNDKLINELESLHSKHFSPFLNGICDRRYDIALFLDPRYVSLTSIYDKSKWQDVTQKVKEMLLKETDIEKELALDDMDAQLTQTLVQLNKDISREIIGYTEMTLANRPDFGDSNVPDWWTVHKNTYPILYQKALEYFSVPMCTMSADSLFGPTGKLARFKSVMWYNQLSKILQVVSRSETFKGRGYIEKMENDEPTLDLVNVPSTSATTQVIDKAPPMPSRIAGLACARPQPTGAEFVPKLTKYELKKLAIQANLSPSRFIRQDEDTDYLEDMLMCPPPPVLEPMTNEASSCENTVVKMEEPPAVEVREVKAEIVDPDFEKAVVNTTPDIVKKEEPDDY